MKKMRRIGVDRLGRCGVKAGLTLKKTGERGLRLSEGTEGFNDCTCFKHKIQDGGGGTKMLKGIKQSKASCSFMLPSLLCD